MRKLPVNDTKEFTANTVKEVKVGKIIEPVEIFIGDVIKEIKERKTAYLIVAWISMLILLLAFFLEGRKTKKQEKKRKEFEFRIKY